MSARLPGLLNALPGALPPSFALPTSVNNITPLLPATVTALIPNVAGVYQAQVPLPFVLTGPGGTLNPPVGLPEFRRAPMLITIPNGAPGFATQRTGFLGTLAAQGLRPGMPAFDQFTAVARTILACPGDSTGNPSPDCAAARAKAQLQMASFLTTGTPPAP